MKYTITLDSDKLASYEGFVDVCEDDDGKRSFYNMSLNEFIGCLTASQAKNLGTPSPSLPRNIIRYINRGQNYDVYIDVPKTQRTILFNGSPFTVGFPRLIFHFQLTKGSEKEGKFKVVLSRIVATKLPSSKPIEDNTELFLFPYSHVSGDLVCMGGNNLPDINSLSKLESLYEIFFRTQWGTDYGANTKLNQDVATLFTDTFNEKDFDDSVLVSKQKTFGEYLNLEKLN